MTDGNQGQNVFPDADNYADSSFPQPVPPPSVDPDDEGTLITVQYSWHWREVLMGAMDQLLNPATWDGDHDEIILALNRAANLKILLNTDVPTRNLAPYWQDTTDIEGEVPPDEDQNWWGVFDGLTFQASLENVFIAQFVGLLAGVDKAVQFLFIARRFRLEFESDPYGGIVDIFVNSERYTSVDTYAPSAGIVGVDILMSPETLMSGDTLLIVLTDEANESALGDDTTRVMRVVRKRLIGSEVSPDDTRWLSPDEGGGDEGTAQQTFDDGETWVDKPGIDPRHNAATYQFPPRTGGDPKCDAAASIVAALRTVIDIVIAAPSVISAVNNLLNYVKKFIPEIGIIIQILSYIGEFLSAIKDDLETSFTEETYDGIQCVLFCHLEDDGTITADGLGAAIGDICDQFDDTVCTACQAIIQTWWGEVGTTNAGTIGSITGDCDDCDDCTWCWEWTRDELMLEWTFDYPQDTPSAFCHLSLAMTVTIVELGYSTGGAGSGGGSTAAGIYSDDHYGTRVAVTAPLAGGFGGLSWTPDDPTAVSGLSLGCNTDGTPGGQANVQSIRIHGKDTMPSFTHGSPC